MKLNRYSLAIKQSVNKLFDNKNSENLHIGSVISDFSHNVFFGSGDLLQSKKLLFFRITKVLSPHYVQGYFCLPRIIHDTERKFRHLDYFFSDVRRNPVMYEPDPYRSSLKYKKKVFDPFGSPYIKKRSQLFFLKRRSKDNAPFCV